MLGVLVAVFCFVASLNPTQFVLSPARAARSGFTKHTLSIDGHKETGQRAQAASETAAKPRALDVRNHFGKMVFRAAAPFQLVKLLI